jgi:hypothetical protein
MPSVGQCEGEVMRRRLPRTVLVPALLLVAALPAASGGAVLASASAATAPRSPHYHFALSGPAAQSRGPRVAVLPVTRGRAYPRAAISAASVTAGANVDVVGSNDVVQQGIINGVHVFTCNAGKGAAQNETTIAANGSTLVAGANDYRMYEPSENRYDTSGGFYRSTDGGATWSAGFLPGLVRANTAAPGPYEAAGDPSVAAGPNNTFWYANIAFDRTDAANAISASRSTNGGKTWSTHFVIQTSAIAGKRIFNDKVWVAADPSDPTGNTAYVAWNLDKNHSSAIVISKTTDGGLTWSVPKKVSDLFTTDISATVVVGNDGTVYVTFEAATGSGDAVAFAVSHNGGGTFKTRLIAPISDIPSPLPGATFRDNSFPALALDGSTLHVVWSNWNGSNANVVYMRSTNGGATWSTPVNIGGSTGDQFFPWIAARNGTVYASWFNRASGDTYGIAGAASTDGGVTWSAPVALSTATSNVPAGNEFSFPACAPNFIGDYSGITVDSNGVGHSLWTDIRLNGFDPPGQFDQDAFTATLTASG